MQRTRPYGEQPATQELRRDSAYAQPSLSCDIIMKGGITSGVVYPLAICEIARTYTFKSIGGTSAGAIAAAATAAAELGRQRLGDRQASPASGAPGGPRRSAPAWDQGFVGLAQLPAWIGSDNNLISLFQPQSRTRPLFRLLLAAIGDERGRVRRIVMAAIRAYPYAAVLGLVPGLALAISAATSGGLHMYLAAIGALLLLLLGPVVAVGFATYRSATVEIPANRFGLCSGGPSDDPNGPVPLTPWLAALLDDLAGHQPGDPPLTFGELWGGTGDDGKQPNIRLQMVTTCLTLGRPFRLPFENNLFYFNPEDFRALFPAYVVDWMVTHSRERRTSDELGPLLPLPAPADMPVVVAARMSLSFPLLISAVPLYAIDYQQQPVDGKRLAEAYWFSDGGITSNLPVHLFETPLPRWPTFIVNLVSADVMLPDGVDPRRGGDDHGEEQMVMFPRGTVGSVLERQVRYEKIAPSCAASRAAARDANSLSRPPVVPTRHTVWVFLKSIGGTMQNWVDSTQIVLPGFRERTVNVVIRKHEGGLNLNMPPEVTDALSERGRISGVMLRERFSARPASPTAPTWDGHRWIRYRSAMASLEQLLRGLLEGNEPVAGDSEYESMIVRGQDEPPPNYRWRRRSQREFALRTTRELLTLTRAWLDASDTFAEGSPRPGGELRLVPRL